ncbi:hypothetical protein [Paenibacillus harenae]|uniref:Uncharacterized protein n=1 Tax=Paenibacillus harenae TaxID=306543 RepID=A0ABT9U7U6_PAEHA|nr:hypothetical protein [Paenibacillus harenae]MDQ0062217.1 hypothetical protein [Paenibacillus harenae]MDQ0114775.1 hypothetical protein [Paenibacillus harenae]
MNTSQIESIRDALPFLSSVADEDLRAAELASVDLCKIICALTALCSADAWLRRRLQVRIGS